MFKRLMPRARGMAYLIRRRSCAHHHRPGRPRDAACAGPECRPPSGGRTNAETRRAERPAECDPNLARDGDVMGQKVRPTGFRVGVMEDWRSRWYASKHEFTDLLVEDFKIRKFIKNKYSYAGIPKIEIERTRDAVTVLLLTARPGVIIGRKGAEVEKLQEELQNLTGRRIEIKIVEVDPPGDQRPAGRRGHRRAAPEAVELPADHEAGASSRRWTAAPRGSRSSSRAGWAAPRCRRTEAAAAGLDPALDAPGQDRLRVRRGQDRAGPHRRQGMGSTRATI